MGMTTMKSTSKLIHAPIHHIVVVLIVVLGAASLASATILADWDLADLTRRADLIVIGEVQEQSSRVDKKRGAVITETEISVERTLMGKKVANFTLTQLGGRAGSVVSEVMGDATLQAGDHVLLFTFEHEDKRRYLVGMALGAWTVDASLPPNTKHSRRNGAPLQGATPLLDGTRLLQTIGSNLAGEDGKILPAPGKKETTIADVKAAIEEVASAGPAATSQRLK